MEELGRLQSMGLQIDRHDLVTKSPPQRKSVLLIYNSQNINICDLVTYFLFTKEFSLSFCVIINLIIVKVVNGILRLSARAVKGYDSIFDFNRFKCHRNC